MKLLTPQQLAEIRKSLKHISAHLVRLTEQELKQNLKWLVGESTTILDHITALEGENAELTRGLVKLQRYMRSEQDETHLAAMYEDELGIWVSYLDLNELLSKQEQE